MKARLIALGIILSALTGGTVLFVNWNDGSTSQDTVVGGFGMLEVIDRRQCSVAACNAPSCVQAQNIADDAGTGCTVGFVDCSIRVGQRARDIGADAGLVFGPQTYQRVRLVGMRCSVAGGFTYGVPTDDAGWPLYAVSVTTPLCVRAPLDGGSSCLRDVHDGDGGKFFGTGNVFPVSQAAGSSCDQVECAVIAGDNPDVSL